MFHLNDGALRRMLDEPLAASDRDRAHRDSCPRCQARAAEIAGTAERAAALLAVEPVAVNNARAWNQLRTSVAEPAPAPRRAWARLGVALPRAGRPLALAAVVAVVAVPAAAYGAPALEAIFAPKSAPVTTVTVQQPTQDEIAGLPDLSKYGTVKWVTKPTTQSVLTPAEAEAATGLTPAPIPASLAGKPVTYTTVSASEATFTFSEAMAKQAAAAAGKPAPVFPPGIDGAVLDIKGGPALAETIGQIPAGADTKSFSLDQVPVVIAQSKAPVVSSTGVSVQQLEDFLAAQPGIAEHPDLVAEIHSIGDPVAAGELVLPIPAGYATSTPITVNGRQGQLVTDKTSVVRAVVWEKGDTVYVVGGHLDQSAVLAIAATLG